MRERAQLLRTLAEHAEGPTAHEPLFRTGEVAAILRVSPRAVRSWADDGKISCTRTKGGHRLYSAAAVRDALRRMEGS